MYTRQYSSINKYNTIIYKNYAYYNVVIESLTNYHYIIRTTETEKTMSLTLTMLFPLIRVGWLRGIPCPERCTGPGGRCGRIPAKMESSSENSSES